MIKMMKWAYWSLDPLVVACVTVLIFATLGVFATSAIIAAIMVSPWAGIILLFAPPFLVIAIAYINRGDK